MTDETFSIFPQKSKENRCQEEPEIGLNNYAVMLLIFCITLTSVKPVITHFNSCTWQNQILHFYGRFEQHHGHPKVPRMSSNSLFITFPIDKSDHCVGQCFSLNIKLASWQQTCSS